MSAINQCAKMRREYLRQTGTNPERMDVGRDMLRQLAEECHPHFRYMDGKRSKDMPMHQHVARVFDSTRNGEFYLFGIKVRLVEDGPE